MRRVRSAPADLCSMSHRQRPHDASSSASQQHVVAVVSNITAAGEDDVLQQVVQTTETQLQISDSWEQMAIGIALRGALARRDPAELALEVCVRLFISYVTHQFLAFVYLVACERLAPMAAFAHECTEATASLLPFHP